MKKTLTNVLLILLLISLFIVGEEGKIGKTIAKWFEKLLRRI